MRRENILFIDDEKDLCKMVQMNLERTGEYKVTVAYSGAEGITKIKEKDFDLAVTDFKMSGMDGKVLFDTLKIIKPLLPVIIFSIYAEDPDKITTSIKEKAAGLLSKPIDHERLYRTIKKVLSARNT